MSKISNAMEERSHSTKGLPKEVQKIVIRTSILLSTTKLIQNIKTA